MTTPPKKLDPLFQQAVQHHHANQLSQAQKIYQQILTENPRHENALYLYAASLHQIHNTDQALPLLQNLLAINPYHTDAHATLAEVHLSQNNLKDAITHFEQSLTLKPAQPKVFMNLATAWQRAGDPEKALACFAQSLKLNPHSPLANFNLANLLRQLAQYDTAITYYRRAIQLNPNFAEAHSNLGYSLKATGQLASSLTAFQTAHQLQPQNAYIHSGIVYLLQFHPDQTPQQILLAHTDWFERHAKPLTQNIPPHTNDLTPNRRLRIGYVSPDFRNHCQSFFTLPLLEHHDHAQFEIYLYADIPDQDAITHRIRKTADLWRTTSFLSDEQLASAIRNDKIDILIDLTMHMAGGRLLTFARKPAPLQITWLAYPGTTGLPTIDYRLSDPHLDPSGSDINYTEKTLRLPDTFWCYDPLTETPTPNDSPYKKNHHLTFGCLNNFCKVNPEVLDLWSQVLTAVPTAHLLILCNQGDTRTTVQNFFTSQNIALSRIEFENAQPREKYLELYHRIDIALDTFPYNGHTTSLDALWMGVPIITLVGQTIVGRAGLSQLTNLNLPQYIAHTKPHYLQIAIDSAHPQNLNALSTLRAALRQRLESSPLMNAQRFTTNLESLYHHLWQSHTQPPI